MPKLVYKTTGKNDPNATLYVRRHGSDHKEQKGPWFAIEINGEVVDFTREDFRRLGDTIVGHSSEIYDPEKDMWRRLKQAHKAAVDLGDEKAADMIAMAANTINNMYEVRRSFNASANIRNKLMGVLRELRIAPDGGSAG